MNFKSFAVDFDGTLCVDEYPGIGKPNLELITYLMERKSAGDKLILWTCREGEYLEQAVRWCREQGLEFDAVNDNLPEYKEKYGNDCRKVFASVYIDDKCMMPYQFRSEVNSKEAERLATDFLNFINTLGSDSKTFAETVCRGHKTLQQSVMRLFITTIEKMAEVTPDDRNAATVELAKEITELAKDYLLPLI